MPSPRVPPHTSVALGEEGRGGEEVAAAAATKLLDNLQFVQQLVSKTAIFQQIRYRKYQYSVSNLICSRTRTSTKPERLQKK